MLRAFQVLTSLLLLACICTAFSACRPKASTPTTQALEGPVGEPVTGDWIVERLKSEPPTLNPLLDSGGAVVVLITDHIFESMIKRNYETLEWEPSIAESWEVSEDHLTYTFNLRKDVKFSDGMPLTSADVKFTFDTILNPANDTAVARGYFVNIESVLTPDDYKVQINCSNPYFLHLEQFGSLYIYPKHIYGEGEFNNHPANRKPVGTGPFLFHSWDTGQQLTLVKRDDYWGTNVPYVDRLVYKFITDDNAAFQVLQQQQVDVMEIGPEKWVTDAAQPSFEAKYRKIETFSPVNGYLGKFTWIGWNMRQPMFKDKRVRLAMTLLLDRQTMLDTIFQGLGRVVSGYHFPDSPGYDPNIKPWPYDPDRAYQLLDEAGWVDTNNNGVRDKDGAEFTYEWIYPSGTPEYDRLATVYKEQLQRAGIEVTLRPLEWGTFTSSLDARNFGACMLAWVSPPESDPYQIWHSSQSDKGSNYVGFQVPEADKLIEAGRVEFDPEKRAALNQQLHAILHEEQPYTFLFNTKRKIAIDKRFQNVEAVALGFDVYGWWAPKQWQRYGAQ